MVARQKPPERGRWGRFERLMLQNERETIWTCGSRSGQKLTLHHNRRVYRAKSHLVMRCLLEADTADTRNRVSGYVCDRSKNYTHQ